MTRAGNPFCSGYLFIWSLLVAIGVPVLLAGCSSSSISVYGPKYSSSAGSQAMQQYDTDGDGVVSGAELDKAPGLKAALARFDTNEDKGVSADEITERIAKWQDSNVALTAFGFQVTLDGQPLPEAEVIFEPEAFLGEDIKLAAGKTGLIGDCTATIPKELRPDPKLSPPGVNLGLYKVKISKIVGGKETVPRKYNEETILGQEVARDVPEIANNRVKYALTSK
jgi:hypothetical protein